MEVAIVFIEGSIYAARFTDKIASEYCGPLNKEIGRFLVSIERYPDVGNNFDFKELAKWADAEGKWILWPSSWPKTTNDLGYVWSPGMPDHKLTKSAARFYKRHGQFSREGLANLVLGYFRNREDIDMPLGTLGVRDDHSLQVLFAPDSEVPYFDATVADAIEYLLFTIAKES